MRVFEAGTGEPIVFVHGALVNANLWRKVVPRLSPDFRCVTLDLPLGSHELPVPDADLSTSDSRHDRRGGRGARARSPTIVANDTGGGLTQIALAAHPELAGRVVLTSCDAYENFPPRFFRILLWPARFPAAARLLFAPLRIRALRATPLAYGWLRSMASATRPATPTFCRSSPRRRQASISRGHARVRPEVHDGRDREAPLVRPARPDRLVARRQVLPSADGERLAGDIPNARLEWIEDAYTFSMEDQPERLAELIASFVREPAGVA